MKIEPRQIALLGVPLDLGAGRRGVDMGPSAVRLAGLEPYLTKLGHEVQDLGNVSMPVVETLNHERGLRYAGTIATTCASVYDRLRVLPADTLAITLGGDHSIALGSVAGSAARFAPDTRLGVIWIDAHADINTPESSPSGNIHGMPVSHLLGMGEPSLRFWEGGGAAIAPEDIVYIGLRSLDPFERETINSRQIRAFTMSDIDQLGIAKVAKRAREHLAHTTHIHISFDADSLDPSVAPGVGTPVSGGLTYREAHLLMELLARSHKLASVDLVEVNPILDVKNTTASITVELGSSLLGKTIL